MCLIFFLQLPSCLDQSETLIIGTVILKKNVLIHECFPAEIFIFQLPYKETPGKSSFQHPISIQ